MSNRVNDMAKRKADALAYLQNNRLMEAKDSFTSITKDSPRDADAWHMLSAINGMLGLYADSEQCAQRVIDLKVGGHAPYNNLGLAQLAQGKLNDARRSFEHALKLNPRDPESHNNLGTLYYKAKELDKAENAFTQAIKLKQSYASAHNNLGNVHFDRGHLDKALECYKRAIELDPRMADASYNMGRVNRDINNPEQAMHWFQYTLKLDSRHAHTWQSIGDILRQQNRYEDAVQCYNNAITANPNYIAPYLAAGNVLHRLGRKDEALAIFNTALRIDPQCADTHFMIAVLHVKEKNNEAAIAAFRETLRINPEHSQAQYLLAAAGGSDAPKVAPRSYIADFFDGYADNFESHLVDTLEYRVPEMLKSLVEEHLPPESGDMDIIDMGCGTGLCAKLLRPWAKHLIGVDLSPKMVDKAKATGLYDELLVDDLLAAMDKLDRAYDLIVFADVLVYLGVLDDIITRCKKYLKPNGMVAFSVENNNGNEDYVFQSTARYSHSRNYIERLATNNNLQVQICKPAMTRRGDGGTPIDGALYLLKHQ